MSEVKFSFEDLDVWHDSIKFAEAIMDLTENLDSKSRHYRLIEQLESSSASIAMNIAEGKGRFSKKEFIQYLYIARGSLFETVTLLTLFHRKGWLNQAVLTDLRDTADQIGKKISNLINSIKKSMSAVIISR